MMIYWGLILLLNIMNKEVPVVNRLLQQRQFQKNNDLLLNKIMTMKFSNMSALKSSPNTMKHKPQPRPIEYNRVVNSTDQKQTTIKTVVARQNMRSENKKIYDRLVKQKSTVSAKVFADERQRNIQFLKRIGRYPYNRNQSMKLDPLSINDQRRIDKAIRSNKIANEQTERIDIRLSQISLSKNKFILSPFPEQQKKQHMIILFSKVVKLSKIWYQVRFIRFKNHYQIFLQPYPDSRIQYTLRLEEQIGTAMLSQNDYNYQLIYTNFMKFTHQYICFSFELNKPEKKKHFYRFQRRNKNQTYDQKFVVQQEKQLVRQKQVSKSYRKTIFAIENQKIQQKQQNSNFRRFKTDVEQIKKNTFNKLETVSSLNIRIPG